MKRIVLICNECNLDTRICECFDVEQVHPPGYHSVIVEGENEDE